MTNEAICCVACMLCQCVVYEIKGEVACGLNVQFGTEYGWLLGENFQNYIWQIKWRKEGVKGR